MIGYSTPPVSAVLKTAPSLMFGVVVDGAALAPGDISAPGAPVRTVVVTADEERVMDRQTRQVLSGASIGDVVLQE